MEKSESNFGGLPSSAQVVGTGLKWLRIGKLRGAPDALKEMRQDSRWPGSGRKDVLASIIEILVPEHSPLAAQRGLLVAMALEYSKRWDGLRAEIPELTKSDLVPAVIVEPVIRFFVLDLALRWPSPMPAGGLVVPEFDFPIWLKRASVSAVVEHHRKAAHLSQEKLAVKVGVGLKTVESWCRGPALPQQKHIVKLAGALGSNQQKCREIETALRLASMCQRLRGYLNDIYSMVGWNDRWADLTEGLFEIANAARRMRFQAFADAGAVQQVATQMSAGLCDNLAYEAQWKEQLAADFLTLSRAWTRRVRFWLFRLAASEKIRAETVLAERSPQQLIATQAPWTDARLAQFNINPLAKFEYQFLIRGPRDWMSYDQGARLAESCGQLPTACDLAEIVVQLADNNPGAHGYFAYLLGQLMRHGFPNLKELAAKHFKKALALDPDSLLIATRLAELYFNAREHHEAESTLSSYEPKHAGEHHAGHYWYVRGLNNMALAEFTDAQSCLERACNLSPAGPAALFLIAVLKKNECGREAQKLATLAKHSVGFDPLDQWQQHVDPFVLLRRLESGNGES